MLILSETSRHFQQARRDFQVSLSLLLLVIAGLVALSFWHYLFFHVLAELFAVIVALIMFVVAWHTYSFSRNHFLMYLGCGYFWIAWLDVAHALLYKGMPTALDNGNAATQFWIATRSLEALLLLSAPLFMARPLLRSLTLASFGLLCCLVAGLIIGGYFPVAFIEGSGLTPFKINIEYVICVVLIAAMLHLHLRRDQLDQRIYHLMLACLGFTIGAELAFTFYVSVYGLSNLIGHIFKLLSFWLVYVAIIRTTLAEPFTVMARGSSTYNAVPDPILLVDRAGIIHQANRAACRKTGLSEAELIGQACHAQFHPPLLSVSDCPVCQAMSQGLRLSPLELEMGAERGWRQFTLTPVSGEEQNEALVHVSADITQRKYAEAALHESLRFLDEKVALRTHELNEKVHELEQTRDQLVSSEKMAALGRLVAGFAHEVNTPLGIAVSSLSQAQESIKEIQQMLSKESVSEEALLDSLNTVLEADTLAFSNLQRATNLVQRFKRSSVDQSSLALRHFRVCEVIEDILASLRNQLKRTKIQVTVQCPDDLTVKAAPGIIEQVLLNLLQNTLLHAYPQPDLSGQIQISSHYQQQTLFLEYCDDGQGIDADGVAHIFEPFYTTRRGQGGSGLGLYVCYNLLSQEGGSIHCDSAPGQGTRFQIRLPLGTQD